MDLQCGGSFGGARPSGQQKSDSALSRQLERRAAEANALRTLDARRAAEANALRTLDARRAADQAANGARSRPTAAPLPSGPLASGHIPQGQQYSGYGNGVDARTQAPAPIVIRQQSNGLGDAVTGFLLGRATSAPRVHGSTYHRNSGAYTPDAVAPRAERSFFSATLRVFAWLAIAAIAAWLVYCMWKFLRRRATPLRAHYAFER